MHSSDCGCLLKGLLFKTHVQTLYFWHLDECHRVVVNTCLITRSDCILELSLSYGLCVDILHFITSSFHTLSSELILLPLHVQAQRIGLRICDLVGDFEAFERR